MNLEESLELFHLSTVLDDYLICKRLPDSTLKAMLKRYSELIDKFVKPYELPENSDKNPLKD